MSNKKVVIPFPVQENLGSGRCVHTFTRGVYVLMFCSQADEEGTRCSGSWQRPPLVFAFSKSPSAQSNPKARVVSCEAAHSEPLHGQAGGQILFSQLRASPMLCVLVITFG